MRYVSRLTALCLALLYIMMPPALAKTPFLRHAAQWDLNDTPVDVLLTADVTAHMPYDDDRLAMLTPLTDLMSLRLITWDDAGSVTIAIAGEDVLTLLTKDGDVQFSCIPDVTFTSGEFSSMDALLGEAVTETGLDFFGLRGDAETLLDDGEALLSGVPEAFAQYGKRTNGKTNISGMGTAQYRYDYTIPAENAAAMQETLLTLCPEGWLREILTGLTFTGKQTLRVYYTADDQLLRMEFTGDCGYGDDIRETNLVWRMKRTEADRRDEITLHTPARIGTDKNTLTFTRSIVTNKKGAIEMTGEFAYTVTKDKQTDVRKSDFALVNTPTDAADVLSGKVNIRHLPAGDDKYDQYEFEPALTISGTQDAPVITGTLIVREKWASGVTEEATLTIDLKRAEASPWSESTQIIDLSALTESELAQIQQQTSAVIATTLVRPLILALGEDAQWFFKDLDAETIQAILDAAQAAAQ